jgi:hypothetical protein
MTQVPDNSLRRRLDWRLAALVALTSFYLHPALKTGYWSEDCSHSVGIVGRLVLKQSDTLLGEALVNMWGAVTWGRFFPLTPALVTVVFYLIRDVVLYKAYLVAVTVLDVVAFYMLVRKLSGNRDFACFAGCIVIALLQFRVSVDPLLAYYGQIQLVTACLFLSLLALKLYLEGKGRGWLVASTTAYLLCTLAYEATYLLFFLHLLLISRDRRGWRARLKPALPFLVVVGSCAIVTIVVRRLFPSDLYVHRTNLDPKAVLLTIANQISAVLPLSYFLADPMGIFPHPHSVSRLWKWIAEPRTIGVFVGALLLCRATMGRQAIPARLPAGVGSLLVILGLLLVVLPVLLIAVSPLHQTFIALGVGWIVVMIQCFGVSLLVATPIWMGLQVKRGVRLARCKSALVSVLVASLMGLTYRANTQAAACFSAPRGSRDFCDMAAIHGAAFHAHRLNLESALAAGLMEGVPDGSALELANLYPGWHDLVHGKFFYAKHTGKSFNVLSRRTEDLSHHQSSNYRVWDFAFGPRSGFVVLSHLSPDKSSIGDQVRLFVRHPGLLYTAAYPGFFLEGGSSESRIHATVTRDARAIPEVTLIRAGHGWGLFSLRTPNHAFDSESLRMLFDAGGVDSRGRSAIVDPLAIRDSSRLTR